MAKTLFRVTDHGIDVEALLADVGDPGAGGTTLFVGTTRNENEGRIVERLEYEAYDDMALAEMRAIGDAMKRRWGLLAVAMVHRIGVVPIADASVAVAVAAPHRDEAFAACRFGIDTLKAQVPIWKKEFYADGSRWIGACAVHEHRDEGA